jgi:superfamily II DNA or RNA helicase
METTATVVNQQLSNMSLVASIESLDESSRKNISDDLIIRIDNPLQKYSKAPPTYLEAFQASSASISLPFAWAISEKIGHRPGRSHFPGAFPCFEGECRGDQKEVKKKCMRSFNSTGSVLVSCFPGWGKTFLAINLASSIKLKTIIFVNKIVLMKQWENSIRRFVKDAKVAQISTLSAKASQRAQQKWEQQWDSDFVIINAINVPKMPQKFLSRFGFVVVDECHQLVSACLSRALLQVHPRYLLGLSATPYRKDGLDRLIALYFGKNKITKKLFKLHHVHVVETGFRPRVKHTVQGRLDWNAVLESQSMDENRNNLIVDWTLHFCQKKRKILILTKRICQAEILVQKLIQKGENSIATLWGGKQTFDKRSQILIGTSSKIGVGFDHKHLDCLILASDIKEYFIQYLGRVFRQPGTTPVIVDFVDDHGLLRRHFGVRKKAYTQHGGQIIATKINKEKK